MPFAFLVCLSWQRRDTRTSHTPLTASTQFSVTAFRGSPGQEKDGGKPDDGDYIVRKHNQITHGRTALIALRHNAAGTVNEALSPCRFTFPGEDLWPGLGAVEEPRLVRRGPSFGRAGSIVSPSNRRRESFLKERLTRRVEGSGRLGNAAPISLQPKRSGVGCECPSILVRTKYRDCVLRLRGFHRQAEFDEPSRKITRTRA